MPAENQSGYLLQLLRRGATPFVRSGVGQPSPGAPSPPDLRPPSATELFTPGDHASSPMNDARVNDVRDASHAPASLSGDSGAGGIGEAPEVGEAPEAGGVAPKIKTPGSDIREESEPNSGVNASSDADENNNASSDAGHQPGLASKLRDDAAAASRAEDVLETVPRARLQTGRLLREQDAHVAETDARGSSAPSEGRPDARGERVKDLRALFRAPRTPGQPADAVFQEQARAPFVREATTLRPQKDDATRQQPSDSADASPPPTREPTGSFVKNFQPDVARTATASAAQPPDESSPARATVDNSPPPQRDTGVGDEPVPQHLTPHVGEERPRSPTLQVAALPGPHGSTERATPENVFVNRRGVPHESRREQKLNEVESIESGPAGEGAGRSREVAPLRESLTPAPSFELPNGKSTLLADPALLVGVEDASAPPPQLASPSAPASLSLNEAEDDAPGRGGGGEASSRARGTRESQAAGGENVSRGENVFRLKIRRLDVRIVGQPPPHAGRSSGAPRPAAEPDGRQELARNYWGRVNLDF
jgi:hypothetical protein